MYLFIGATGTLGGGVASALLERGEESIRRNGPAPTIVLDGGRR